MPPSRVNDLILAGSRFASGGDRDALLAEVEALEELLASWLDRLEVVADEAPETVKRFLGALESIDGHIALLHVLLGRQRPHCSRLAQAVERLRSHP